MIDAVPRWVGQVTSDRKVDEAVGVGWLTGHDTLVAFVDKPVLKLLAELSLGLRVERHQHQS